MKRVVLFDLDGTLTDSGPGITAAASAALAQLGIDVPPERLAHFVGPPLDETFREFYGLSPERTAEAIGAFRAYYDRQGWRENAVYPGIPALLRALKAAGCTLLVATSKPEHFALRILTHFGLADCFDLICGAPPDDPQGMKKPTVLREALRRAGVSALSEAVMVGDRKYDVAGAHAVGLAAVGVLYGYGSRAELEAAGADALAERVADLRALLIDEKEDSVMETHTLIAKDLLRIGAVFFRPEQPFTWASGIKSPVYCDNRLTLTAPDVRGDVENGLAQLIRTHYPAAEVLMGTSTAGIAHAAITAHLLGLPMGYVRSGAKDHGRENRIEGRLEPGQKVVVVEDLISTAGSVIEVVEALREAGAEVLGIVSIFTYGMRRGLERLAAAHAENHSLTNFDVIARVAADEGYIRPEDVRRLLAFRDDPADKSWIG